MTAPRPSRRLVAGLLAATLVLPCAAQGADAAALERVERYLEGVRTLRADFSQEVVDAAGSVREQATGELVLERPGRFRWDYREPYEQQLVSDGSSVWLYDVELEQVTVREIGESLSTTPAMLLSGEGDISDTFEAVDGGRAEGLDWVVLTPRLEESDFRLVRLAFRGDELDSMELEDRLGQTARIRFSAVERNPALPDGLFDFDPPPGVDVVGTVEPR